MQMNAIFTGEKWKMRPKSRGSCLQWDLDAYMPHTACSQERLQFPSGTYLFLYLSSLFSIQEKVLYPHTSVFPFYFEVWSIKLILNVCLKKKKRKRKEHWEHKVALLFYFNSTAWRTYGTDSGFVGDESFIQEIKPNFSVYSNIILLPLRFLLLGISQQTQKLKLYSQE